MPISLTRTRAEASNQRITDELREASPSTGYREGYVLMEAAESLGDAETVATIENSDHVKDFFRVSS